MNRRMKKLLAATAILGALVIAGCQSTQMSSSEDPAFLRGDSDPHAEIAPQNVTPTQKVAIDNFTFTPAELTVPAGSTVVWVNHDDVPHTVVSNAKAFASKALDTDDQYSHVFASAGRYPYFCSVHPHMIGQIIVK